MNRFGRIHGLITASAALLAVGILAGCGTGSDAALTVPTTSPTTTTAPLGAPQPTPASLSVTATDLGAGWLSKTIPGGAKVTGQVTLDLCGGNYPSEALRTARLQTDFKHGAVQLSNEVVRYTAGGAEQAYRELTQRAANCPTKPVLMPETGVGKLRFMIRPIAKSPAWAKDTFAARVRVTQGRDSQTSLVVYQFSGDWMSAVYGYGNTVKDNAAVRRVAALAAAKLKQSTDSTQSATV